MKYQDFQELGILQSGQKKGLLATWNIMDDCKNKVLKTADGILARRFLGLPKFP